jgi:hypothetical protein
MMHKYLSTHTLRSVARADNTIAPPAQGAQEKPGKDGGQYRGLVTVPIDETLLDSTQRAKTLPMHGSLLSPSLGPASTTSDSRSSSSPSTTRTLSCCSSGPLDSLPRTFIYKAESKASEPLQSLSPLLLRDLQLRAAEMPGPWPNQPLDYHDHQLEPDEDDLILSPPASPAPTENNSVLLMPDPLLANAVSWGISLQAELIDFVKQPWRKFWPPAPGSAWFSQVAHQHPDVLLFSFDRIHHLLHQTHPWQAWKDRHPTEVEMSVEDKIDIGGLTPLLSGQYLPSIG